MKPAEQWLADLVQVHLDAALKSAGRVTTREGRDLESSLMRASRALRELRTGEVK